jgi:hypothetical protein
MLRRLCLAIGMMAVCFCVAARQPALPPMPVSPELQVELIENQNELGVDVSGAAVAVGMQFGLLGALIGSGIQNAQVKNAEAKVVPLRNLLVEYRFNEKLEETLRARLASEGLSPNPHLTTLKTPWDAVDAGHAKDVPLDALVLVPRYSMDSDFSQLSVQLNAQLVQRKIKPDGKVKTAMSLSRAYAFQFSMRKTAPENPVQRWTTLGSDQLGKYLDEGIEQLVDMLVYDFSAEGRKEWMASAGNKDFVRVKGIGFPGIEVRKGDDWAWARVGKKRLSRLQGYHPILDVDSAAAGNAHATMTQEATAVVLETQPEAMPAATAVTEAVAAGSGPASAVVPTTADAMPGPAPDSAAGAAEPAQSAAMVEAASPAVPVPATAGGGN